MNDELIYTNDKELPLDNLKENGGYTAIFRTICCIGDSLSSGEFILYDKNENVSYNDIYEQSWGQYIGYMTNAKVYNFSQGGLSGKEFLESYAINHDCYNKEKDCQAYIIALGVNDLVNHNIPFGSIDDVNPFDETKNNMNTFAGQYGTIISKFQKIAPDAKFFLVTFPNEGGKYHQYALMMEDLFEKFCKMFKNCYVIDLKKYGPKYDDKFKEVYYLHDHLNPLGYKLTATLISSYIDYIIRHNPQDFKYVGLVNHVDLKDKI